MTKITELNTSYNNLIVKTQTQENIIESNQFVDYNAKFQIIKEENEKLINANVEKLNEHDILISSIDNNVIKCNEQINTINEKITIDVKRIDEFDSEILKNQNDISNLQNNILELKQSEDMFKVSCIQNNAELTQNVLSLS